MSHAGAGSDNSSLKYDVYLFPNDSTLYSHITFAYIWRSSIAMPGEENQLKEGTKDATLKNITVDIDTVQD